MDSSPWRQEPGKGNLELELNYREVEGIITWKLQVR